MGTMIPDANHNSFFLRISQLQQLKHDDLNEDDNQSFLSCPVCGSVHLCVKEGNEKNYFGDLPVYVKATCPICLEECGPPVIALPCGHILCRKDYISIGGNVPSSCMEKENVKKDSSHTRTATTTTAESCTTIPNQVQRTSASGQNDERINDQQSSIEESTQTTTNIRTTHSSSIDESTTTATATATTTTTTTTTNDMHTPTTEVENDTPRRTAQLFSPSSGCKILDDNCGGTWMYCRKSRSRYWCLIHINAEGNRKILSEEMSPDAKIIVDRFGCAWCLQSNALSTENAEPWNLWKYSRDGKEFQGKHHSSTTIKPCSENRVQILINFPYLNHSCT